MAAVLERGREIRAKVVKTRRKKDVQALVRENVEAGSNLYTDALKSYKGLSEFAHQVVDHAETYVNGQVHTNGCRELLESPEARDSWHVCIYRTVPLVSVS